jgi:hypothetical protein
MPLLVTSAAGANGDGYGALLAFDVEGSPLGAFSDDARIADPRGMAVDPEGELLFLNSGADRVLALDRNGRVVRDTGPIPHLDPGGGVFGPDGRYHVGSRSARTIVAFPPMLDGAEERVLPEGIVPFPRGFGFSADGTLFLSSGVGPNEQGDHRRLRPRSESLACAPGLRPRPEPTRPRRGAERQHCSLERKSVRCDGCCGKRP